jgi:hypothetical protein
MQHGSALCSITGFQRDCSIGPGHPIDSWTSQELLKPAFTESGTETGNIIAVMALEHDLRIFVQQGAFTIHSDRAPLDERTQRSEVTADSRLFCSMQIWRDTRRERPEGTGRGCSYMGLETSHVKLSRGELGLHYTKGMHMAICGTDKRMWV